MINANNPASFDTQQPLRPQITDHPAEMPTLCSQPLLATEQHLSASGQPLPVAEQDVYQQNLQSGFLQQATEQQGWQLPAPLVLPEEKYAASSMQSPADAQQDVFQNLQVFEVWQHVPPTPPTKYRDLASGAFFHTQIMRDRHARQIPEAIQRDYFMEDLGLNVASSNFQKNNAVSGANLPWLAHAPPPPQYQIPMPTTERPYNRSLWQGAVN